jgi:C-3',4' desaturase CrtD
LLLKAGHQVTILEAHVYPGGSASTFYHQKYQFDAGATLAGGFSEGGPHARLAEVLDIKWPVHPVDPAWQVHLPDGRTVTQWADPERWQQERRDHFPGTEGFWSTQERLADLSWDISSRPFPWPPQKPSDLLHLARALRPKTLRALPYLSRNMASFAPKGDPMFDAFLDGQLLISAQTTADQANALYGSAALDLPRRGVNHVRGGIGSLATTLVDWIRREGGQVLYRQEVDRILVKIGQAAGVITKKGHHLEGDAVVANLTPWALSDMLGDDSPTSLQRELSGRPATWGAFVLYLGLEASKLKGLAADHHQVIVDINRPLGEGNSVFISLSDESDPGRAPEGKRAATLSSHTAVAPWWRLNAGDRQEYLARRDAYTERLLDAAERVVPSFRNAIDFQMAGTPVTFETFTRRPQGMVGGFPMTSIWRARGPRTGVGRLWLVGDSIFPGQSTAGVTLGAMRVAADVVAELQPRKLTVPMISQAWQRDLGLS